MTDEEEEGDVGQPVVDQDRLRKPEACVALAVPEQYAGDREQQREDRGQDRIHLLARIETTLWWMTALQPVAVVAIEQVDLTQRRPQAVAITDGDDQHERDDPGGRGVDVDALEQWTPAEELRETRQVEREARREQDDERRGVHPVDGALRPREPRQTTPSCGHS